ncbi:DddA-like double-stranded DNA deaminase toxin [Streptoalloteichus hindustanus]|uniref:DddA-like double-stranded DNA deaminase toxin n=1 Tax=Streptoalloteichus hindustanus TaxID=2017 RepID=UPI000935E7EA
MPTAGVGGLTAEVTTAADVELKLAARMIATGTTRASLVINNRPCPGPFGCCRSCYQKATR